MEYFDIWKILGIITPILLVIFWGKKNAVWGGFAIGIILGLIVALFLVLKGSGFDWYIIGKGAISGAVVGFLAELLGKVSDLILKRR